MVDGVKMEDPLYRDYNSNFNKDAINEMVVISGTFNAEYGDAMSGIVNITTRDGGTNFSGRIEYTSPTLNESKYRTQMRVAVMGCVVNGPGESKHADIGISLPGTNEYPVAPVYVDGEKTVTLKGERIAEEFQQLVEDYVRQNFGPGRRRQRTAQAKEIPVKAVS